MRKLWGAFIFLLVLGSLGACGYLYTLLRREQSARVAIEQQISGFGPRFDQFKDAVRDVDRRLAATVFQEVDLGAAGWQPISGGLYVSDLSSGPAGKGLRIAGKIINPTSVTHDSAQLSIRAGEKRATFTLAHLPPAVAEPFEVTLPDVPAASTHKVFFAFEGSTISFATSSTRKRGAGEPVDTDKLLH
ncbi:MAG TPA: hypothetical protein VKZ18_15740 [Polyangia bacterium]|nr:hypothetical protein [Polyangia bacterium]